jgi:class 3 adenylate cyclase
MGVRLAVGIGIHTGPVILGTLGDESRQELLALGETPTIAAGLQGLAPPDGVVVSAVTARLLQDAFVCEALGTYPVQGLADPMTVLQVWAARTAESSPVAVVSTEHLDGLDEAERRQLTVMFCDLADAAQLTRQLPPERLLTVVQAYQQACSAVVQCFEGYIAQYLEHGVLAYFGFPQAHEDDAQRAVRAGLEIVEAMPALNARLPPQERVRVAARIGIHTGRVVAGAVGGGTRTEQLAVGATPNVAARIHGLPTPDAVVISATTRRLVQGCVVCEDLGTHVLKGVADPMPVARVLAHTTAQSRLEVVGATALSPLVGRDADLAVCVDCWARSLAAQGQVVVLRGEPAIGKSRLVEALHTHINPEEGTRLVFRSVPYHTNSAFYPITSHLERRLQLTSDEPAAAKVAKLEQWLESYHFPQPETVPLLATLLSVPLPEGRYPPLPRRLPQQRQRT